MSKSNVINLTPHPVIVRDEAGNALVTVPVSGQMARVKETNTPAGTIEFDGVAVELLEKQFSSQVEGLPAQPQEGTMYIVPLLTAVAAQAAGRSTEDLLVPGFPTRGENGTVNGCRSLARLSELPTEQWRAYVTGGEAVGLDVGTFPTAQAAYEACEKAVPRPYWNQHYLISPVV